MDIDRNGGLEPGQCGSVTDTDAIPFKTDTNVRTGVAGALDISTDSLDMKVLATPQPVPIEACIP